MSDEVDELWYSSTDVNDDVGHAIIPTYNDLNGTVGFIVYGYTAEDTPTTQATPSGEGCCARV